MVNWSWQMKTLTTTKKFYDKWLYKVTIDVRGHANALAGFRKNYENLKQFCSTGKYIWNFDWFQNQAVERGKPEITKLVNILEAYPRNAWSTRLEGTFSVYTNDVNLYTDISNNFDVIERSEPAANTSFENPNTISVKKLPFGKYRYKVFLKPHKIRGEDEKVAYIDWLVTQKPRITLSTAIMDWIMRTRWTGDPRYILVEDENTLLMLRMRNDAAVGRIYEYIVI